MSQTLAKDLCSVYPAVASIVTEASPESDTDNSAAVGGNSTRVTGRGWVSQFQAKLQAIPQMMNTSSEIIRGRETILLADEVGTVEHLLDKAARPEILAVSQMLRK